MRIFFSNFLVVVFIVIVLTRVIKYLLIKNGIKSTGAAYVTFVIMGILLLPIAIYVGFDVVISEYVIVLILCLIYDVIRGEK